MKKSIFTIICCLSTAAAFVSNAQTTFPHSAAEDKAGVMSKAYWDIWNSDVQARIDADIEANRKADASIVLDGIRPGTEVKVEQVSSDFYFGAHLFNYNQLGKKEYNDRYKELYGTLFNSATVAFYWKVFETEPGRLRFVEEYWDTEDYWNSCEDPMHQPHWRRPATDPVVEFCISKGLRIHGHTLVWGNRKWQHPMWLTTGIKDLEEKAAMERMIVEYGNLQNYKDSETYSDEYKALTPAELSAKFPHFSEQFVNAFDSRIRTIAERYKGVISSWDVVNESSTDYERGLLGDGSILTKSIYGIMPGDYPYRAFKVAAESFPEYVKLNINDYNLGQCYVDEVNDIRSRGGKIDVMGSQMHLFNPKQCLDIADGAAIQTPEHVYGWYGRLSKAGLPIHLSEITITAPGNDERGRQIQAVITRNLYRLWFSLPQMNGITWWNVVDNCGAPGEPSVSGLFTRDMQPKTSYYALDELINHEWKTSLTVRADDEGKVTFRGFKGKYILTWTDRKGRVHTEECHVGD